MQKIWRRERRALARQRELIELVDRGDRTLRELINAFWTVGSRPAPGATAELAQLRLDLRDFTRAQKQQARALEQLVVMGRRLLDRTETTALIITDEQQAEILERQQTETGQRIRELLELTGDTHIGDWPTEFRPVLDAINRLATAFLCQS